MKHSGHYALSHVTESFLLMGTTVTFQVVGHGPVNDIQQSIQRALKAMTTVEQVCSRFDENSALNQLCQQPGKKVAVPPILFHVLRISCELASITNGVFDPSVGSKLEQLGFNRHYLTDQIVHTTSRSSDENASYRDISLFEDDLSVRLNKPMQLDLGGIAKGLAIDLAAKELEEYDGFAINAGGDIYVFGHDPTGDLWTIGIENPLNPHALIGTVQVTNMAVCTSGNYKRRSPSNPLVHHLYNPITDHVATGLLSCTVMAPLAIVADSYATAAFLLGPQDGLSFLTDMGFAGLFITEQLERLSTPHMTIKEYLP
ncbi:FAD:protein FMN transferase [Sulfobacillus thermosulfidooxidans]|uniref:FAD:protein FMN transferase n=1 Tax=Sulfobacillus thermosulfidooxidans TaxID=28034 RepID=UPI0006B49914|nr:FAD:protein FMN transferase [Sulfobacillus thermosulfidooxidans]